MKLTIIGCTGSMSGKDSPASSYLVQAVGKDGNGIERLHSVILDFGPGAMGHSTRYVDPAMVDAIVLSHLHADHCVDLVGMQVYRRWYPSGALSKIDLVSPGDARQRMRGIADDPLDETYEHEYEFISVEPGSTYDIGPLHFEFFEAWHTIPTLAMRITGPSENGKDTVTLTYTGDTDYVESVVDAAKDVDLLLSEAAFEEERDTVRGVHLTGLRAGELAAAAGARRLLLTHLQPWTDPVKTREDAESVYTGEVTVVRPGDVYTI